jgi:uncharacterized protein (DUF1778 family)
VTTTNPTNPLNNYFRQPAVYIKLPSGGEFYPEGALDMPVTGEIPVYPMTVRDEIALKTPDALMNGAGVVQMIASCCPNIRDPWAMPATDIDAVFVAIRIASSGADMTVDTECPHCKTRQEQQVNLTALLDQVPAADFTQPLALGDLTLQFQPQSYQQLNRVSLNNYEQARVMQQLDNPELDEASKKTVFTDYLARLTELNIDSLSNFVHSVTLPDGTQVTEHQHIVEFLTNSPKAQYRAVKQHIDQLVQRHQLPKLNFTCENCEEIYSTDLVLDQSNFFD